MTNDLIQEGTDIIEGDREKTYGDPSKNIRQIAAYWSAHIGVDISADDVCIMMCLLKLARLVNSPDHEDSMVDLIGYNKLREKIK